MEGKDECCLWLLEERIGSAVRDTARALISGDVGEWFSRAGVSAVITDSEGRIIAANATFSTTIGRSEEHTSELQSLMRISYAVFCLKKKKTKVTHKPLPQLLTRRHNQTKPQLPKHKHTHHYKRHTD